MQNAMQNAELRELKSLLETEKVRLEELLGRTAKHLYRREEPYNADFAEQVVEVENNQVVEALDSNAKIELQQIQAALVRIEQEQYGLCRDCGDTIAIERLKLIPYTDLCANCA